MIDLLVKKLIICIGYLCIMSVQRLNLSKLSEEDLYDYNHYSRYIIISTIHNIWEDLTIKHEYFGTMWFPIYSLFSKTNDPIYQFGMLFHIHINQSSARSVLDMVYNSLAKNHDLYDELRYIFAKVTNYIQVLDYYWNCFDYGRLFIKMKNDSIVFVHEKLNFTEELARNSIEEILELNKKSVLRYVKLRSTNEVHSYVAIKEVLVRECISDKLAIEEIILSEFYYPDIVSIISTFAGESPYPIGKY